MDLPLEEDGEEALGVRREFDVEYLHRYYLGRR